MTGAYHTTAVVAAALHGNFTANVPGGLPAPACTATFNASGSLSGAISAVFSLTYVFPGTLVVTLNTHGHVWVGTAVATNVNCLRVGVTW